MKDFKKKIAEIEKINQAAKSNYNADKFIRLLIVIAILIVYVLIVRFMRTPNRHFWFRIINCITMFPQLSLTWELARSPLVQLANGKIYRNVFGVFVQVLCYIAGFAGVVGTAWNFGWDEQRQVQTYDLKTILIVTLITVVISIIGALVQGSQSPHSAGSNMSRGDWVMLKNDMEVAGIDPNKMPLVLDTKTAKSMTRGDWVMLKNDLTIAGYDVELKRK